MDKFVKSYALWKLYLVVTYFGQLPIMDIRSTRVATHSTDSTVLILIVEQ